MGKIIIINSRITKSCSRANRFKAKSRDMAPARTGDPAACAGPANKVQQAAQEKGVRA